MIMNKEEQPQKAEIRSEDVEDILGRVPSWITRNGILLFTGIFALIVLGSFAFRYPDVKRAGITLTSLTPPAELEARADGKIEVLLVEDNAHVEPGMLLAVIENSADYRDVLELEEEIGGMDLTDVSSEISLPVNGESDLGPVQDEYATFFKDYRNYREFLRLDYHRRKIELLRVELEKYQAYSRTLHERSEIVEEEYRLAEKQFVRDSMLYLQSVVSESDYEASRSAMLVKRNKWQELMSQKAENDIQAAQTEEKILEMELKQQERMSSLTHSMEESLNKLRAAIAAWKKDYVLVAPVSGTVTFNRFWSENQNVRDGDKVLTIVPDEAGSYLGKIRLPAAGAGEVKPGQQVNIRFDNYPYLEYGMVRARVSNISRVPENDFYTVEVYFPNGLTTFYGIDLGFSQNMQGQAEILTDKMRLIELFFNPIRNAITRQREM